MFTVTLSVLRFCVACLLLRIVNVNVLIVIYVFESILNITPAESFHTL